MKWENEKLYTYIDILRPHSFWTRFRISLSPRWKGDCGGKKQFWFPANYVEEISPSAAEPDRTVRIKTHKLKSYNYLFVYFKRNECTCLLHREVGPQDQPDHSSVYYSLSHSCMCSVDYRLSYFLIPPLLCKAGDDREQPSGRSAERKCGCLFLSDWWVAPPFPVLHCAAGLQSQQSPCQRVSSCCGCCGDAHLLCTLCF